MGMNMEIKMKTKMKMKIDAFHEENLSHDPHGCKLTACGKQLN